MTTFKNTLEFARELDAKDPLKDFRKKFHLPTFTPIKKHKLSPRISFMGLDECQ